MVLPGLSLNQLFFIQVLIFCRYHNILVMALTVSVENEMYTWVSLVYCWQQSPCHLTISPSSLMSIWKRNGNRMNPCGSLHVRALQGAAAHHNSLGCAGAEKLEWHHLLYLCYVGGSSTPCAHMRWKWQRLGSIHTEMWPTLTAIRRLTFDQFALSLGCVSCLRPIANQPGCWQKSHDVCHYFLDDFA